MEYLGKMTDLFLPLAAGEFYHIYNRGNNGNAIFFEARNYHYFLEKLGSYLGDYLNFYAYCLLPNHFHLMVQVKEIKEIPADAMTLISGKKKLSQLETIISEQFRRFFLSYSKSIKMQENRTGSLFEKNFKRILINDDKFFLQLINYIHRNPATHKQIVDFTTYPFSSYQSFLQQKPTRLRRKEVLELFGGSDEFIRFHQTNPVIKDTSKLIEVY
jgi:putative transposase